MAHERPLPWTHRLRSERLLNPRDGWTDSINPSNCMSVAVETGAFDTPVIKKIPFALVQKAPHNVVQIVCENL